MIEKLLHRKTYSKGRFGVKAALCLLIFAYLLSWQFSAGLEPYYRTQEFYVRNHNQHGEGFSLAVHQRAVQTFGALGNSIRTVYVFYCDAPDRDLKIELSEPDEEHVIACAEVNTGTFQKNTWNEIALSADHLSEGQLYKLILSSDSGLDGLLIGNGLRPDSYIQATTDGEEIYGGLVVGLDEPLRYMTLASIAECITSLLLLLFTGALLCAALLHLPAIRSAFRERGRKGLLFALVFSMVPVLVCPTDFQNGSRALLILRAAGIVLSFLLLFMLANAFVKRDHSAELRKVLSFLSDILILAVCSLALLYLPLSGEGALQPGMFRLSVRLILLAACAAVCYAALGLDRYVSADLFEQWMLILVCVSLAVSVLCGTELENGRLLTGIAVLLCGALILASRAAGNAVRKRSLQNALALSTVFVSFLPLAVSVYTEVVHVLNQHSVFVFSPELGFLAVCVAGLNLYALVWYGTKKHVIRDWRKISYPALASGAAALSIQIPLSSVYPVTLPEKAGESVVLSSFLNYGEIPFVQHYSAGLKGFPEGLLYSFLNQDYTGIASPYALMFRIAYVLLVYYLVSRILNRQAGLAAAILFPCMEAVSPFGGGLLVCLAAMAYVRRGGALRAAALWGSVFLCLLYGPDTGIAFGVSALIAMLLYVADFRSKRALKELGAALAGWILFAWLLWLALCRANGISASGRLQEMLSLSFSSSKETLFSHFWAGSWTFVWGCVIVPSAMILSMLYTVFSRRFRERTGAERWVLLLILDGSWAVHTVCMLSGYMKAEDDVRLVTWSAYLALAVFASSFQNRNRWFLPAWTACMLAGTLALSPDEPVSEAVVDAAAAASEGIIESWTPSRVEMIESTIASDEAATQWETYYWTKEAAQRVELPEDVSVYLPEYKAVMDALLGEDETFVDLTGQSWLYAVQGYRCPVYAPQTLQNLPEADMQEAFVKEAQGTLLALLPQEGLDGCKESGDPDGISADSSAGICAFLDRQYRPLCRLHDGRSLWCRKDRYALCRKRLQEMERTEYAPQGLLSDELYIEGAEIHEERDGSVEVRAVEPDPKILFLEKLADLSAFAGRSVRIEIEYETDLAGCMQLFYTTEQDESITAEKVCDAQIEGSGTAVFIVPVTEYTMLRLDIPDDSTVTIRSITAMPDLTIE